MLRTVQPSDYYSLMLAHTGTDDPSSRVSEHIKSDHMALRVRVKVRGAQMIFSSMLMLKWKGLKSSGRILRFSALLCSCVIDNGLTLKPQDPL